MLTADPAWSRAADGVVLPGVGAFGRCMEALRDAGLEEPAQAAIDAGMPFLGICVGMQMLYDGSEEDPDVKGMGVLPGAIRLLPDGVKRPQMQWNVLDSPADDPCWPASRIRRGSTSSTLTPPSPSADVVATCDYGGPVVAAVQRDTLWATQFHPEKSGATGLRLLANLVVCVALPGDRPAGRPCVRLYQGDFGRETVYGIDPVAVAEGYAAAGAPWIHVVDLDAARTGTPRTGRWSPPSPPPSPDGEGAGRRGCARPGVGRGAAGRAVSTGS